MNFVLQILEYTQTTANGIKYIQQKSWLESNQHHSAFRSEYSSVLLFQLVASEETFKNPLYMSCFSISIPSQSHIHLTTVTTDKLSGLKFLHV
jgi:hypothetical protein